jgi:hypothetical protein
MPPPPPKPSCPFSSSSVGFRLPDILEDRDCDLSNLNNDVSVEGTVTVCIRINMSSHILSAKILIHINWPTLSSLGYDPWIWQMRTRDRNHGNPITLTSFMRHIGLSVDRFIDVSFLLPLLSLSKFELLLH